VADAKRPDSAMRVIVSRLWAGRGVIASANRGFTINRFQFVTTVRCRTRTEGAADSGNV
jgi:hypothetical protein